MKKHLPQTSEAAVTHRGPVSVPHTQPRWWEDAVGYQIYLRSFADSNNDGVGDLGGIIDRLGYLARLGVDFVWITPFYPTPGDDWGYDVADYCDIDPLFGDLPTFDRLVARAHDCGLRVVTDLVPNHTSSRHRWFRAALGHAGPQAQARYRDYYIWRDPLPDGGPPNNWVGHFGGPAWTLEPDSGQYYLHMFLPSQPDLNWRNPAVAAEWDDILRFWLDRGVDGFRVDVAGGLVKDARLRSNPQLRPIAPNASRWEQWECFEHRHDVFQPETQDVFRRWRVICDRYDAFLHGETYQLDPQGMDALLPPDAMHGGYWFGPMHIEWQPDEIRRTLRGPAEEICSRLLWAASSHDMPRAPTRFGRLGSGSGSGLGSSDRDSTAAAEHARGAARTLAWNVLAAFLPGTLVLYQGEELGLVDGSVAPADKLDPVGPDGDVDAGRDGCRTPMPWDAGPHNGFCEAEPWLRSAPRPHHDTAAAQADDEQSWLGAYRRLLEVQRQVRPDVADSAAAVEWDDHDDDDGGSLISYRRGRLTVTANVGDTARSVPVPAASTLLYDSAAACRHVNADAAGAGAGDVAAGAGAGAAGADAAAHVLAPASAVVWRRA